MKILFFIETRLRIPLFDSTIKSGKSPVFEKLKGSLIWSTHCNSRNFWILEQTVVSIVLIWLSLYVYARNPIQTKVDQDAEKKPLVEKESEVWKSGLDWKVWDFGRLTV